MPTPVTVLNGFLGAGKTTLLKMLLRQAEQPGSPYRLAVLANDLSDLDVDENIILNSGLVGGDRKNFISISRGSIASKRLLPAFRSAIVRLMEESQPTHILIETSGSTHPWPLIEALRDMPGVRLHGFLSLVDSVMLHQDYDQGASVIEGLRRNLTTGRRGIENLLAEQIMFANRVVLTKIDRLPQGALRRIGQAIHPLNPYAAIVGVNWGGLRLDDVLGMPAYDFHRVARLGAELAEDIDDEDAADIADPKAYKIGFRIVSDPRPFHPRRLWDVYNRFLGTGIHRSKGFFWLPSRDELVLLWNQAAGSISLDIVGYWKIVVLEDPTLRLTPEERQGMEQKLAGFSPLFGDRRCELTVIGQESQLDTFVAALQSCFCTDEEITGWRNGETFDDPWPTTTMHINFT